ncbi:MAG: thioredoxin family protein [Zymomonas mobilis subsp. pomaceae]|uniref:Cytochrome c biogenesis protein transmembrane region n=1 Tax=Zymomonas mobilis subsp. pomaceae (strain ATCC 29192 / DSM 22645 / JCM 10191 / CCUG 17912 / NBRC 13757 / NCIMB 11200 / NRRL B-4491 / Barker I) TaxID=579138 RepID=F8ERV1_ZYMMT|nr:thioredoxin family protein [Zymomonas mobilis]AEI38564.1 cytochrome c biogenesis protein transmembrane region [Zymomonas mobilis subsp. pomaceae ATCC 29192]MDX5948254.1 thioredoxin family protein [Zymomonas mobilis subsp. pomaceae]GEB89009.1 thiol:disulfide interchange protein DsbD [Zymomonas mobilis subsp. pomaceae]
MIQSLSPARLFRILMLGVLTLLSLPFYAASAHSVTDQSLHIEPRLVAETLTPRSNSVVTLALVMSPKKGWHGYWKNGGDAGQETQAIWTLPQGVSAGILHYPVPERMVTAGLMSYIYARDYAELTDIKIPAGLNKGTPIPLSVKLNWLSCTDTACVPETATLTTLLHIGEGALSLEEQHKFDYWRSALPKVSSDQALFTQKQDQLVLKLPYPASEKINISAKGIWFFPYREGVLDYTGKQQITHKNNTLFITLPLYSPSTPPKSLEGVLRLAPDQGIEIKAKRADFYVPEKSEVILAANPTQMEPSKAFIQDLPKATPLSNSVLWFSLGGAILGGLILNIMPCVFPILSLKALSLARAHSSEKAHRLEALAYTAGVILVCLGLGGGLLILRAGGHAVGWAFQLQYPHVVLALMILTGLIGFNLAGLFELPSLNGGRNTQQDSLSGAFVTGALAAFVATPCTGPFMAAAMGIALMLPPIEALIIFAGLGLGIALPFLAIGFLPSVRRLLPRPGAWMSVLRHLLSIPMFITALWLGWILGHQIGSDGLIIALSAFLIAVLGLWWTGKRQNHGKNFSFIPAIIALVFTTFVASFAPADPRQERIPIAHPDNRDLPFSQNTLDKLRQDKKPVFVYLSADWCLSCKVNEKMAIDRPATRQAFQNRGITVLQGDWTNGDPEITHFLGALNRSGVPLYLYYPSEGTVQILPQILTPALLQNLGKSEIKA